MAYIPSLEKRVATKIMVTTFKTKGASEGTVKILCEFKIPVASPDRLKVTSENIMIRLIIANCVISIWLPEILERRIPIWGERIKIITEITKNA